MISNQHIDEFIEIISTMGVTSEDIESYLYISQQFEMCKDMKEKLDHLQILENHFQSKYPHLYELLEEEISIVTYKNFH